MPTSILAWNGLFGRTLSSGLIEGERTLRLYRWGELLTHIAMTSASTEARRRQAHLAQCHIMILLDHSSDDAMNGV